MKRPGAKPLKPARPITGAAAARELWHKGATSGHVQKVRALRLDCDSDSLLLLVEQIGGAACHSGRRSCFYREWKDGNARICSPLVFDPHKVYGG